MTPKVCILSVRIFFKRDCEWGMQKGRSVEVDKAGGGGGGEKVNV